MARIEEATLFRPDPKLHYPGGRSAGGGGGGSGGGRGGGGGGGGGDEDDGPNIAVRERVSEAARSARRRKGLSFVVVMICGALTVLGAIFAPRNYEVEATVLVAKTTAITGGAPQQFDSPEAARAQAKEYEQQIMAKDNIIAIVREKRLVERWDDMRQPHRRLIDKVNRKLGKPAPGDDEKFEALVNNINGRMRVFVDANTVVIKLEWSAPEAARDIMDAAVKNFLEARFQSEVGVIPERLKILEAGVTQAHKDLEASATELNRLIKLQDPKKATVTVAALPHGVIAKPQIDETQVDPALRAKLENVRNQINVLQEAKLRRLAELNQELIQKKQTLAEGHPEIIALKQTIAATEQDPPQLASLKVQEAQILQEIAQKQKEQRDAAQKAADAANAAANKPLPMPKPTVTEPEPVPIGSAKSVQDAEVLFQTVSKKYTDLVNQLDTARLEMLMADKAFKNRYKVTHPAEVPGAPKRPVALIAIVIGVLSTIAAVLAVASLADRFSGIFFEPRDVRDRLGLPVFATFS